MPSVLDTSILEYEVEVLFVGFAPLSFSFSINIYPENPIGWKIITAETIKDGILSGDEKDLHEKILGMLRMIVSNINNTRLSVYK